MRCIHLFAPFLFSGKFWPPYFTSIAPKPLILLDSCRLLLETAFSPLSLRFPYTLQKSVYTSPFCLVFYPVFRARMLIFRGVYTSRLLWNFEIIFPCFLCYFWLSMTICIHSLGQCSVYPSAYVPLRFWGISPSTEVNFGFLEYSGGLPRPFSTPYRGECQGTPPHHRERIHQHRHQYARRNRRKFAFYTKDEPQNPIKSGVSATITR